MNRKGNAVLDGITVIIIIFVLAISFIFSSYAFDMVNEDLQVDDDISAESKAVAGGLNDKFVPLFNNLFLFAFILFVIFVLVSVFMIDTHPIFFGVSVILLIFVFVVGGLLANAYNDIASDDTISAYANEFTYISWVMGHLLEIIIALSFLISIALFAKFQIG